MPLPPSFGELSKPLNFKAQVPKLFFLNAFASYSLNRVESMIRCETLMFETPLPALTIYINKNRK